MVIMLLLLNYLVEFPDNVHVLSLKPRDGHTGEVALRVLHLSEGSSTPASPPNPTDELRAFRGNVTIDMGNIFRPSSSPSRFYIHGQGWNVTKPIQRSLSLNNGIDTQHSTSQ